jgi:hypothetical protein
MPPVFGRRLLVGTSSGVLVRGSSSSGYPPALATALGAEESNKVAAEYGEENLSSLLPLLPTITAGEIVAQNTKQYRGQSYGVA